MNGDDEKFVNDITEQLDRQAEALDGQTLSRLRQARASALAAGSGRQWHWQPVAAFASAAVLAVAVWLALPINNGGEHNMAALDDMELLASRDDLEMYEELEFYAWLEGQDEKG